MTTLGFATIVTQIALAWTSVTGGGIGVPGPTLRAPFDTTLGLYLFAVAAGALCTWMTLNLAAQPLRPRPGRHPRRRGRRRGQRRPQDKAAALDLPVQRRPRRGRRRPVRHAPELHHPRRLHLRPLRPVLHRHPDRRPRLRARPAAGHHPAHRAPRVRRPAGRLVHLPLRRAAARIVLLLPGGIADLLDRAGRRPLEAGRTAIPRPDLLPTLLQTRRHRAPPTCSNCAASRSASAPSAPSTASTSTSAPARSMA